MPHFQTRDRIDPSVFTSPGDTNFNVDLGPTIGAHPFNWSGWQVNSVFTVDF